MSHDHGGPAGCLGVACNGTNNGPLNKCTAGVSPRGVLRPRPPAHSCNQAKSALATKYVPVLGGHLLQSHTLRFTCRNKPNIGRLWASPACFRAFSPSFVTLLWPGGKGVAGWYRKQRLKTDPGDHLRGKSIQMHIALSLVKLTLL